MAMASCHKEYVKVCEILVCVDVPAPHNPGLYQRLRFGLLSSSWLPRLLGILLWSALHVMLLIVGGPAFWVVELLATFIVCGVYIFCQLAIYFIILYGLYGLYAVAVDLILLLGRSIRFCCSIVGFWVCHKPTVEWRGGACLTVEFWKCFKATIRNIFWVFVPIGVPCMAGSLYKQTKEQKFITWARWSEEVVHMHDAIAL